MLSSYNAAFLVMNLWLNKIYSSLGCLPLVRELADQTSPVVRRITRLTKIAQPDQYVPKY